MSDKQDNGGAAFPSLRDYAAVQFMAAMISTQAGMANISKVARESKVDPKICAASAALEFADAFLSVRDKP